MVRQIKVSDSFRQLVHNFERFGGKGYVPNVRNTPGGSSSKIEPPRFCVSGRTDWASKGLERVEKRPIHVKLNNHVVAVMETNIRLQNEADTLHIAKLYLTNPVIVATQAMERDIFCTNERFNNSGTQSVRADMIFHRKFPSGEERALLVLELKPPGAIVPEQFRVATPREDLSKLDDKEIDEWYKERVDEDKDLGFEKKKNAINIVKQVGTYAKSFGTPYTVTYDGIHMVLLKFTQLTQESGILGNFCDIQIIKEKEVGRMRAALLGMIMEAYEEIKERSKTDE